jgi:hypothetical protein
MEKHLPVVAWLHMAHGAILLTVGVFMFILLNGAGFATYERPAILATGLLSIFLLAMFVIFGLPHVIGGLGLYNGKTWARMLVIVMSFMALPAFPVGTAIGIYSFWVLFNEDIQKIMAR